MTSNPFSASAEKPTCRRGPGRGRAGSPASPSGEGDALADLRSRTRPRSFPNPSGPGASGPRCARWRGCQALPGLGGLSQPPSYAAEPGLPARPPPRLSPGCPRARRRLPAHAAREEAAAAQRESTWAGAGRRPQRFRSCARARVPRAPRLQVRRPRRASACDSAARAAAARQQTRCGQPAGTGDEEAPRLGPTAEDRASRVGRDAGAKASPPASLLQLGCRRTRRVPGTEGGLGWAAGPGRGGATVSGCAAAFGHFPGEFPERQVLGSGFCPLDFSPAFGRLKGNQKRVSDTKTPY